MNILKITGIAVLSLLLTHGARAAEIPPGNTIVYDNGHNYLQKYASGIATEYGDEVNLTGLAVDGAPRVLTDFIFEYFGDFVATGAETARIRFYRNDGPAYGAFYTRPGTMLYDSGNFPINSGQRSKALDGLSILAPDTMTWTVQFGGIDFAGGKDAGLLYSNPVTIGSSFRSYYWQKDPDVLPGGDPDSGGWRPHVTSDGTPNNFMAQIRAVPEPSTITLFLAGVAGLGGCAFFRRRSS